MNSQSRRCLLRNKFPALLVSILVMLGVIGCNLNEWPPDLSSEPAEPEVPQKIVSPSVELKEIYYRGVLPYQESAYHGVSQLDALQRKHFEAGMVESAVKYFDPEAYLFQEGQILTDGGEEGLDGDELIAAINELAGYPFVVAVHEYDFLTNNGKFGGVVLGIAVLSQYTEQPMDEEGNPVHGAAAQAVIFSDEQIDSMVQTAADELVLRLREYTDVPIVLPVLLVDPNEVAVPSGFIREGFAKAESRAVDDWEEIQESFLLLPSQRSGLPEPMRNTDLSFRDLQAQIEAFFPDFAGVYGMARFMGGEIAEWTLTVTAEYNSRAQIMQLVQFIAGTLPQYVPDNVHVNLYVSSIDQVEAVYVRPSDGSEFLHILRD